MKIRLLSMFLLIFAWFPLMAQDDESASGEGMSIEQFMATLNVFSGKIELADSLATLDLTPEYSYINSEDASHVLEAWGNPPGESLGMIFPTEAGLFGDQSWAVIITYDEDGYVKDDDADDIDYDDLLETMLEDSKEADKQRVEAGYTSLQLVGWAEKPTYDKVNHKLYWAKELVSGQSENHALNYNIRVLGREGVLVLNALAGMEQLQLIKAPMEDVLAMVSFNEGNRYVDFDPKLDRVAAYGIGGLILGKVALKAGFFKVFLAALIAGKKFILLGVIALGGLAKKIFSRGNDDQKV